MKQCFPAVKRGWGDSIAAADLFNGHLMQIVMPQDMEDEPQGIGAVRDKAGRMDGMSMPAGGAPAACDPDRMGHRTVSLDLHQIPVIVGEFLQASLRFADRTGCVADTETVRFCLEPLPVRKRDLIQLAKESKTSYHKNW